MQSDLLAVRNALLTISDAVYHFTANGKAQGNYFVWAEDGGEICAGDNGAVEQSMEGTIHYFTKTEMDEVVDQVITVLNGFDVAVYLNSVQYEEETGFIHYEWVWEV